MAGLFSPTAAEIADLNIDELSVSELNLLETGKFSDASLSCDDEHWKVHRSILCTRSLWFRGALASGFVEGITHQVRIEDFDADMISVLLIWLYTDDIDLAVYKMQQVKGCGKYMAYILLWTLGEYFQCTHADSVLRALEEASNKLRTSWCVVNSSANLPNFGEFGEGVKAAYLEFPNTEPCQKVLFDLAWDARIALFDVPEFKTLVHEVPDFRDAIVNAVFDYENAGRYCGGNRATTLNPDVCCIYCGELLCDLPPQVSAVYYTVPCADGSGERAWAAQCSDCLVKSTLPWNASK